MTITPEIIKDCSDQGAISSRHGYDFQDYIATSLVLDMLTDNLLLGVRCEKIDDIDLVYQDYIEYIQVKSTTGDEYWKLTDLNIVHGTKTIVQKSLDSDKELNVFGRFRIITERGIKKNLRHLEIDRSIRTRSIERDTIIRTIDKKIKNYISVNNHDIEYWVDNCLWQVVPSIQDAVLTGQRKIHLFANSFGFPVFDSEVIGVYQQVLRVVSEIASLSNRVASLEQKTFSRDQVRTMVKEWLESLSKGRFSHRKIYQTRKDIVLSSLGDLCTHDNKRTSHGYVLEYARNEFRYKKLINNIYEWMPEYLLSPREFAENNSTNCYGLWAKTLNKARNLPGHISIPKLFSEIVLHMLVRSEAQGEPISGMLYVNGGSDIKEFSNVHIVKNKNIDELWLGEAFFPSSSQNNPNFIAKSFANFLYNNLDPDVFDCTKEKIFDAKNDAHLRPHSIDELLTATSTVNNASDRFKFVSLFIYDSLSLSNGFFEDYKEKLSAELSNIFDNYCQEIKNLGDNEINKTNIKVYIFPVESFTKIIHSFNEGISDE